jgi:hypothetical protein
MAAPGVLSAMSMKTTRSLLEHGRTVDPNLLPRTMRLATQDTKVASTGSAHPSLGDVQRNTPGSEDDIAMETPSFMPFEKRRARAIFKAKDMRTDQPPLTELTQAEAAAHEADEDVAEGNDEVDSAELIGRKQSRPSSAREESPELHSGATEEDRPAEKRLRQGTNVKSSAKRSPLKRRKKDQVRKLTTRKKRSSDGEAISVAVQRFTRPQVHDHDTDDSEDVLQADISHSTRGGPNAVDVLLQICEEVIDTTLATLQEAAEKAEDARTRKGYRVKLRALEAFQEELRTRLLQHVSCMYIYPPLLPI